MRLPLNQEQFVEALDRWTGREVAVRVVSASDDLLAIARGRLGERSAVKRPALFWPLLQVNPHEHAETPGVYLHPGRFQGAAAHEGDFVLELHQAGMTLNLRLATAPESMA
jgi:hypothetical protein